MQYVCCSFQGRQRQIWSTSTGLKQVAKMAGQPKGIVAEVLRGTMLHGNNTQLGVDSGMRLNKPGMQTVTATGSMKADTQNPHGQAQNGPKDDASAQRRTPHAYVMIQHCSALSGVQGEAHYCGTSTCAKIQVTEHN